MSTSLLKYRPDIDGLRALAILAVLIFHIHPTWLPGGFVGVDVFFVISGFLITSIIYRDMEAGSFSLVRFYERRIRRIVPALFFMFACSFLMGYFLLLPDDFSAFSDSLIHAVASISNLYLLHVDHEYFSDATTVVPLMHTWSLGVEEQFYLFFPFLLLGASRYFKSWKKVYFLLIGVLLLSLGAACFYVFLKPEKAFYLLPLRAWEMLVGSLLALVEVRRMKPMIGNVLGIIGLLLVMGSMVLFNGSTPFPGAAALAPCVGAALLILAGRNTEAWITKLFSLRPIVWIGLISYSVYLWHWPIIAFAKYRVSYNESHAVFLLLLSLILGALSWRFIERPFRSPSFLSRKKIFVYWAASSLALVVISMGVKFSHGMPLRFPAQVSALEECKKVPPMMANDGEEERLDPKAGSEFGDLSQPPSVVIWGDSHAEALLPIFDSLAKEEQLGIEEICKSSTAPVLGVVRKGRKTSERSLRYAGRVMDYLIGNPSVKTVILSARWSLYTRGQNEKPGEDEPELVGQESLSPAEQEDYYKHQIMVTVSKLLEAGKTVVVVYPIPEIGLNVPDYLAKISASGDPLPSSVTCLDYQIRHHSVITALDSLGERPHLVRIKPQLLLMHENQAKIMAHNQPLYFDDNHLSPAGAFYLKELFQPVFKDL